MLGADTIVVYDGEILGKPVDENEALDMLMLLSGRRHEVYTGVSLLWEAGGEERQKTFSCQTSVYMYENDRDFLKRYIATGEPLDKAGAYGIQGMGALLVERIDGDYNNVVGLPLSRVVADMISAARLRKRHIRGDELE